MPNLPITAPVTALEFDVDLGGHAALRLTLRRGSTPEGPYDFSSNKPFPALGKGRGSTARLDLRAYALLLALALRRLSNAGPLPFSELIGLRGWALGSPGGGVSTVRSVPGTLDRMLEDSDLVVTGTGQVSLASSITTVEIRSAMPRNDIRRWLYVIGPETMYVQPRVVDVLTSLRVPRDLRETDDWSEHLRATYARLFGAGYAVIAAARAMDCTDNERRSTDVNLPRPEWLTLLDPPLPDDFLHWQSGYYVTDAMMRLSAAFDSTINALLTRYVHPGKDRLDNLFYGWVGTRLAILRSHGDVPAAVRQWCDSACEDFSSAGADTAAQRILERDTIRGPTSIQGAVEALEQKPTLSLARCFGLTNAFKHRPGGTVTRGIGNQAKSRHFLAAWSLLGLDALAELYNAIVAGDSPQQ